VSKLEFNINLDVEGDVRPMTFLSVCCVICHPDVLKPLYSPGCIEASPDGRWTSSPILKLDIRAEKSAPNQFGIYYDTYRPRDTNRKTQCYYLFDPDHKECVKIPPLGKAWYDTIPEFIIEIEALEHASRNK
jgi:hypothetical protein